MINDFERKALIKYCETYIGKDIISISYYRLPYAIDIVFKNIGKRGITFLHSTFEQEKSQIDYYITQSRALASG